MSKRCSLCPGWAFEEGLCRKCVASTKVPTSKPVPGKPAAAEPHVVKVSTKSTPSPVPHSKSATLKPSVIHPLADIARSALRCPHAGAAWTALKTLGIDHRLFNHDFDKCYCHDCEPRSRPRSDGKGSIPRQYTRFALHVEPNQAMARQVFSSWPKAFHGTKHNRVKSISELGYLLIPGSTTPDGFKINVRDGHLKEGHFRLPSVVIGTFSLSLQTSLFYAEK